MKLKTDNIFQVIEVEASVADVYRILMNEKEHAAFTHMSASIDPKIGGNFSTTDNESFGFFLHLIENKKIVQAWGHRTFSEGFFSIVDIELESTENGCRINFNHLGVPEQHSGWLTEGWKRIYWEPLKVYVKEKTSV